MFYNYPGEHHLLPIVGLAHVAYISNGNVIGLSKINRIVRYFAERPQVQERLTIQIVRELQKALNTDDVACVIDAKHLCCLLYTSPSPRDGLLSRMPSSA